MRINTTLIAIGLVLITSQGLAKDRHAQRMLNHLDQDGDALISADEFGDKEVRMFKHADLNNDDTITLEELQMQIERRTEEHQQEMVARHDKIVLRMSEHFARLDSDGDGNLTAEEARLAAFNRMDSNDDGYISVDEIKRPQHRRHGSMHNKHDFSRGHSMSGESHADSSRAE